jgi:23S rRNA (adenine2503-C2)-methyltransferase
MRRRLASVLDASVNWTEPFGKGQIETRYVRRKPEAVAAYVSSHSGCKMGCGFCHLTAQGRTSFDHVPISLYRRQLELVLRHYASLSPGTPGSPAAQRVNVNFMSTGEALANTNVINKYPELHNTLAAVAREHELKLKMNVSTIMPRTLGKRELSDVFQGYPTYVYYSLYSLNPVFRREWFTGCAMPVEDALQKLERYMRDVDDELDTPITFHNAYIEGHNDSLEDARAVARRLRPFRGRAKYNIVRYNPTDKQASEGLREPPLERLQEILQIVNGEGLQHPRSYIVPPVGPDVFASCGTFVPM